MSKKRVDKWAFFGQGVAPSVVPFQKMLNEMMKNTFRWIEDEHPEGPLYREKKPYDLFTPGHARIVGVPY